MTSNDVIGLIKLCLGIGNDQCITLCNFGGRIISGFEVIEKKSLVWIGLGLGLASLAGILLARRAILPNESLLKGAENT